MAAKSFNVIQWVTVGVLLVALGFIAWQHLPRRNTSPSAEKTTLTDAVGDVSYAGTFTFGGEPRPVAYPHTLKLLRNTAYLAAYDEKRANPAWAAYRISGERKFSQLPRPRRFHTDLRTSAKVAHEDYTNSGYTRSHMVPNFPIATRFGEEAQRQTFLMTNVVPQAQSVNQGPWRALEEHLSETTASVYYTIWVVAGPVYDSAPERRLNGKSVVPSAFFMVIATQSAKGPLLDAYMMPQSASRSADFRSFRTTIDAIEAATGLDFHADLPDSIEERLEGAVLPYWLRAES